MEFLPLKAPLGDSTALPSPLSWRQMEIAGGSQLAHQVFAAFCPSERHTPQAPVLTVLSQ